jgi:hypothetical protein
MQYCAKNPSANLTVADILTKTNSSLAQVRSLLHQQLIMAVFN